MLDVKDLKSNLDLVAVIQSRGVKLKARGDKFIGCCPIPPHKEKTPSFTVNPKAQLWHCFGCDAGGDVFSFVQRFENISFMEAVKKLCKRDIQAKDLEELNRERDLREQQSRELLDPVDRPSQDVLNRIVSHWQVELSASGKVGEYLKARSLWVPQLLKALGVGYASGRLRTVLAKESQLVRQLKHMGILNTKNNEFFYNRVVVPIFDDAGVLVNVYGRALDEASEVKHLYLPGPRRGVFNPVGLRDAGVVILTESILDALSLVVLGFSHTTASYGANGFTADHLGALQRAKTRRVYCAYDADPAGDIAADQLAHDLAVHGIEVFRVVLPCKDPNDFLKGGGTKEQFQVLLDAARPMLPVPQTPASTSPSPAGTTPTQPGRVTVTRGDRVYELTLLPNRNELALRTRLKVRYEDKAFIDTLNLYSDRARVSAVMRLSRLFGSKVSKSLIETDLFTLIDEVEAAQKTVDAAGAEVSPDTAMTPAEEAEVLAFLSSPNLMTKIREDFLVLGVIGEDRAKLLVYLVATSRRLKKPLSLIVVSRSSAGKSFLVLKVCELMPEEDVCSYTRVSAKAFFYDDSERLRHKLLTVEEAAGMEEASYALRVMQSNHVLKNLTTVTDPIDGKHKAQENVVHGPVALIVTTTEELDFETASRAFVISVDESVEQTKAIHQMQRQARTLEGLAASVERDAIIRRHQNAQRLLKPLAVVNEFALDLTFPTGTLRLRREHEKYLSLIEAITYLFQYQREQGEREIRGQKVPYVLTTPEDIDLANELVVASLRQAFDEVTTPSRELLGLIRKMVSEQSAEGPLVDVRFNRRALREFTGWSDYQIRIHLKQLEELEYIQAVSGSFGKEYVYTLAPGHRLALDGTRTLEEEIEDLGLTGSKKLKQVKGHGRKC